MPNLVITIEGGVMQGVLTDDDPTTPVRIILQDFDNIKDGGDSTGVEFDLAVDIAQVSQIFEGHDEPTPTPAPNLGSPTNQNVLEGLRCPACGSEGNFSIACDTVALVGDDGIDEYGDMEWDDKSMMGCDGIGGCGLRATVAEFIIA